MDLTYIEKFTPYSNYSEISKIDFEKEIELLSKEMTDINIHSIPFDKYDYIAVFIIALLEIGIDTILGNQISDKNSKLNEYLNKAHEKLNHSGHPLDFQGKIKIDENGAKLFKKNGEEFLHNISNPTGESGTISFGGGNHRARTFSHDLLMFPMSIYMLCSGKFIDGGFINGKYFSIITSFNQNFNLYKGLSFDQAIVSYVTHMVADLLSKQSLPIPGFGILAHFPSRDVRKAVADMYEAGFNLKNLIAQGIPVLSTEILMRAYFYIRNYKLDIDKDAKKHKLDKLLLLTHSIATVVNIGKVIITQNPVQLNIPMIIRVIHLVWKVVKEEINITERAKQKLSLSIQKNKFETLETVLLLDKAIYYTNEIDKFIAEQKHLINNNLQIATNQRNNNISQLRAQLDELKKLNK